MASEISTDLCKPLSRTLEPTLKHGERRRDLEKTSATEMVFTSETPVKRELEYRIPRLHYTINSRRFPDIFGDFCQNTTIFLWEFVENRFLPFAPIDFRRKPEPVLRTQVLSHRHPYTRSPLEDSRLFGHSPWKILAATYKKDISEQPSPWRRSSKRESCYGDRVYVCLTIHVNAHVPIHVNYTCLPVSHRHRYGFHNFNLQMFNLRVSNPNN